MITVFVITVAIISFLIYTSIINTSKNSLKNTYKVISPFAKLGKINEVENNVEEKIQNKLFDEPISILLLGIDRRSRDEYGYRTDIMIELIINPQTNKVAMISVPRDLWYLEGRINALFISGGWEEMQDAFLKITGYRPQRYILSDFKDFSWLIDAMGGVEVEVDTTFTDENYPVDETLEYQIVSFSQGYEKLTGERALIYARSRKGNNGEGSDWMRMKRQHKILKSLMPAVLQPGSIFNPMVVETAFNTITTGKMDTNLSITDAKYLWDFYKDKDKYEIKSFYLDYDYLYSPAQENYGGAWVLISKTGDYNLFQKTVSDYINDIPTLPGQENGSSTDL